MGIVIRPVGRRHRNQHGFPSGGTRQDRAIELLVRAQAMTHQLSAIDYATPRQARRVQNLLMRAARTLAPLTNVSYPNSDSMTNAVVQSLRAVALLETARFSIGTIDNGRGMSLMADSLRRAAAAVDRALRGAMAGTHY